MSRARYDFLRDLLTAAGRGDGAELGRLLRGDTSGLKESMGTVGETLRRSGDPGSREIGEAMVNYAAGGADNAARFRAAEKATRPTAIGDAVREGGGIRMGVQNVPTMRDLGAAPVPEFPVPPGAAPIRRLQDLRKDLIIKQRPSEPTAADYIFQPAIRGMQYPAGSVAEGSMFSARGGYTAPGTRIGGRQMSGSYPSTPMPQVEPPVTARMPEGQMQIDLRSNEQLLGDTAPMTSPPVPGSPGASVRMAGEGRLVRSPGGEVTEYQAPRQAPGANPRMEMPEDPMRPQGVRMVDLNTEFTMDAAQRRNALMTGLGLGSIGVAAMLRRPVQNNPAPEPLVPPTVAPLGETPETPSGATEGELPSTGLQGEAMAPAEVIPTNPPVTTTPAPDLTPEEAAAIAQNTSRVVTAMQQADPASSSAVRAIAPRDPSSYRNIGEYYADQRRFVEAMDQGRMKDIVQAIGASQRDAVMASNMASWAQEYPVLAYQLANREGMVNPAQNQQSGQQLTTSTVGSSMGDNNEASAIGQANAAASQVNTVEASSELEAANLRQRNNELIEANRPIVRPQLSRAEEFLLRRTGRL